MTKLEGRLALRVLNRLAEDAAFAATGVRPGRAEAAQVQSPLPGSGAALRPNIWTWRPALPALPRSGVWLIATGTGEIPRPRAGYAPEAAAEPSAKATVSSPLDFLRDSRLTAEEKLVLLLAQQQKDVEKEIETVIKKAEAKSAQKTSGGGLKSLKVLDVVKSAIPGLSLLDKAGFEGLVKGLVQLSGPVLAAGATALGMPHLAPAVMALGPDLLGSALDAELPVAGSAEKAPANAPNAGTGSSTALDPVETQRLTLLMNRQQQWAGMVSNMLHSMHQTRMNVIQNLR
jgi:hypothetical protein